MGCLLQTMKQRNYQVVHGYKDGQQEQNAKNVDSQQIIEQVVHLEVPLIQEDISDLLTDSSLDNQEIQLIDESIRLRKIKLMKIKDPEKFKRRNSLPNPNKIDTEQKKIRRTFSQDQIVNSSISINNLYYQKFLSQYKAYDQPQDEQKHYLPQNIEQTDLEISEENFSQENSFSSMKQLVSLCKYCTKEIQEDEYQLECFHCYHAKCLEELILNKIEEDQSLISCICHQSIKTKLIKQILCINNEVKYLKLLENQITVLNSTLQ
ncbi:unnamed protein product (macronuclear) [Paramecium tetraurelia]|uniref:RING-type domain-containing protein n=1 Tax=Paramecium tetraurelia TaxID=5888 RepID=A0E886_PARTE|nr:uncharacterized protein GSPATT00024231001 [Paramecium tetraurelia]CAK91503.1 unnamed protein product [Paramecium tetraurelia]|eukprot:XP_001458900.1 hypothetical protein (macronuclear) [Paramecium tetraurelia strain d4-2]